MSNQVVNLDVREDIRQGREPFSKIMQAVTALEPEQDLLLLAPFEPAPLFHLMAQQGFSHQAKATAAGEYEVLFSREALPPGATQNRPAPVSGATVAAPRSCQGQPALDLDARGLEPPQPLVRILEALATLPDGVCLRARTDRRPMHLYAQLDPRGFEGQTEEQSDGSFVTYVRRR